MDIFRHMSLRAIRRRALLAGAGAAALSGCVAAYAPPGPPVGPATLADAAFVMRDGARLPYRVWLPPGDVTAIVLALHGFNDSRDAWEYPAPAFADAGIAVYAPDQRGFGAAPGRGLWPGTQALVDDAADMARLLRVRHPGAPLFLMGESMGGAVLMVLAAIAPPPDVSGYVLVAPAVWGRSRMNLFLRGGLFLAASLVPGLAVGRGPVRVTPTDNKEALIRLSRDPLTLRRTRFDTLRGLVDLMDAALAAAPRFERPGLFLYGGKDDLVPKEAMLAAWRRLPDTGAVRLAYYPAGHHLILRDHARAVPIADIIAWMRAPTAPLPSGTDQVARQWRADQA